LASSTAHLSDRTPEALAQRLNEQCLSNSVATWDSKGEFGGLSIAELAEDLIGSVSGDKQTWQDILKNIWTITAKKQAEKISACRSLLIIEQTTVPQRRLV